MTEPAAHVYIDLEGVTRPVGRLWTRRDRNRETASFEFDHEWLADPVHHALGPALPATAGAFHTSEGRALFGALGDSAPDRWGRRLIMRNEARRARAAGTTPRAPREIDYLLGVTDIVRQGALRFRVTQDGPFEAPWSEERGHVHVPLLIELPELLNAANVLSDDPDSKEADDAVRLLLAPGSCLGGARPKASVRDQDGALAVAKFPDKADNVDVIRWERVMLELAARAGIVVSDSRLEAVGESVVLVVRRFDRRGDARMPFLSAMSLLDAADGDQRSYVEIFDARSVRSRASQQQMAPSYGVGSRSIFWPRTSTTICETMRCSMTGSHGVCRRRTIDQSGAGARQTARAGDRHQRGRGHDCLDRARTRRRT